MKKLVLPVAIALAATNAAAEQLDYVERMKLIQEYQHTKPNAAGYVNSLQKTEEGPQVYSNDGGHYYVSVVMNGQEVRMMADTGASAIFLSQEDAQRMGINMSGLNYNIPYDTANGRVYAAETIVPHMRVGNISMDNVPVSVSQSRNNNMSLLGMDFFNRLSKYEVQDGQLLIYK